MIERNSFMSFAFQLESVNKEKEDTIETKIGFFKRLFFVKKEKDDDTIETKIGFFKRPFLENTLVNQHKKGYNRNFDKLTCLFISKRDDFTTIRVFSVIDKKLDICKQYFITENGDLLDSDKYEVRGRSDILCHYI